MGLCLRNFNFLAFVILLFLASCGQNATNRKIDFKTVKVTEEPLETNDKSPTHHEVIVSGMRYVPSNVTVAIGDTVTWINQDIYVHNIVQVDSLWYSPLLNPGDRWQHIVKSADEYFCSLHVVMKGNIVLQD